MKFEDSGMYACSLTPTLEKYNKTTHMSNFSAKIISTITKTQPTIC